MKGTSCALSCTQLTLLFVELVQCPDQQQLRCVDLTGYAHPDSMIQRDTGCHLIQEGLVMTASDRA